MERKRFRALPKEAQFYVLCLTLAGACTVAHATFEIFRQPPKWDWIILALLTLVSGSAPVRLPALPATISVSETFVFTSVLLFGGAAGTITVALDALVLSCWAYYRKGQPLYKSVFNVCALSFSIWVASQLFFYLSGITTLGLSSYTGAISIKGLLLPLLGFTATYFFLNSGIIAIAIALERKLSALDIWRNNFLWLSLNYFGGASVAVLLVTYTRHVDFAYLAVIVPLLLILYFTFSISMGRVEDANRHLTELNTLYMSTIETLAMAIDAKDQITHGHIRRVQTYATGLARRVGVEDDAVLRAVEAAALLHDMGKLAVPEYILNKPGPLSPAEFEKMKLHASVGADILSAIAFPYPVVPIVRHHHENWDGSGYPDGIAGADIPIGARILSVVDCFDALTSDRPYRPRLSDQEAIRILMERKGTMYDPLVVDTFVSSYRDLAQSSPTVPETTPLNVLTPSHGDTAAHQFDQISGSSEETITLFELARTIRSDTNLPTICESIFSHVRRLIPASFCVFYKYEVDTDEIVAAHVTGESNALVSGIRISQGQRVSGWVAAHRQPIRNADPSLDLGKAVSAMAARPKSCLSVPVVDERALVGVLSLYSTNPLAFTEEHQRILQIVGTHVASQLRGAFSRAVVVQNPTNRSIPPRSAARDQERFVMGARVAVILASVSQATDLNAATPLESLKDLMASCLRDGDKLVQVAGGLAMVLPETDAPAAEAICVRLRALATSRDASLAFHTVVVAAPDDGVSIADLVEAARAQLPASEARRGSVH